MTQVTRHNPSNRLTACLAHPLSWLALLALWALPALAPLFSPTLTRSADGLLHLYRLVQLDALWHAGIFFTRWLPDLAFGYGMPLFNYYAPLVYYLTTPLHWLGAPFPLALNLALAAALFVGAAGTFFFARALLRQIFETRAAPSRAFIPLAAFTAALAYVYAPYILFNALQRANLAEQWALAFAPFALWRFLALTQRVNARNWTLAALAFAAVLLSHNVTSFLFAPALFFFMLACFLAEPKRAAALAALSAFGVALALAAFFWLPALAERDFVQIARVVVTPDFDYRFNFVAPTELFAFLPRADTGRLNPSFPDTLGVVQILLASCGALALLWKFRTRRALPFAALALAALGLVALTLSFSQPLWDHVSLLAFIQLPMRLRGLVALFLAPFVGVSIFLVPARGRVAGAGLAAAALVLSALPLLYPRYAMDVPPNPNLRDMFAYEQATGAFGATSFGEYLPVWVQNLPDQTPFGSSYARGEIPMRLEIPEGVNVCGARLEQLGAAFCVDANDSWRAVYRAFYFPGWRVTLDGAPLDIAPTPRTGLLMFDVKKSGALRVEYVGTTLERLAEWISLAAALLVVGVAGYALWRKRRGESTNGFENTIPFSQAAILIPLAFVAVGLLGLKFFYLDRVNNPFVAHFDGVTVQAVAQPRRVSFANAIEWLGYDVSATTARRGETVRVTLYWRALPDLKKNLSVFAHLTTADGATLAQQDNLHPANVPTARWDADAYAADEHLLQIPSTLAPGVYELRAGVYDPATNARLQTADGSAYVSLGALTVQ